MSDKRIVSICSLGMKFVFIPTTNIRRRKPSASLHHLFIDVCVTNTVSPKPEVVSNSILYAVVQIIWHEANILASVDLFKSRILSSLCPHPQSHLQRSWPLPPLHLQQPPARLLQAYPRYRSHRSLSGPRLGLRHRRFLQLSWSHQKRRCLWSR